jgi:putative hydrolase of the HAD superfamily
MLQSLLMEHLAQASLPPQVIFFDAVGTLFGVRGGVGQVYAAIARQHGVEVSAATLDRAFFPAFQAAGAPAFPGCLATDIPQREYEWWRDVAISTFAAAGVFSQFVDFDAFFADLFAHFGTAQPWILYPDSITALETLQQRGIPLGIVSNFDSRLYQVLAVLGLAPFFQSVTISTEAGAAKPRAEIFQVALAKHHCPAAAAWHVGDSWSEDYQAATAVGLQGLWLQR